MIGVFCREDLMENAKYALMLADDRFGYHRLTHSQRNNAIQKSKSNENNTCMMVAVNLFFHINISLFLQFNTYQFCLTVQ